MRPALFFFFLLVFSFGCGQYFATKNEIGSDFPKELNKYTLLVEHISLPYLQQKFDERDSDDIVIEYRKIDYIEQLYLVKEPKFPNLLVAGNMLDSTIQSDPKKYRYILKHRVVKKKIDKVNHDVIAFYFWDAKEKKEHKLLEDQNYNTKASMVLTYNRIKKAYSLPSR